MIKLAFFNLFRRKTRTFLSVVGIAIGVAAIIVLVSLVDGFTVEFDEVIGSYNAISVLEKDAQDQTLSSIDISFENKLDSIPNVKAAIPEIWLMPQKIDGEAISFDSLSVPTVYGLDAKKFFATGSKGWIGDLSSGAKLTGSDLGEVMIGKKIEEDYDKFVGSIIKVDGEKFRVKGIFETDSDFISSMIVMNLEDARDLASIEDGKVHSFSVFAVDPTKDKELANFIELKYSDELDAYTQEEFSAEVESILGSLRLLAIAVALISSAVAGIGIMNTILMSVLERFSEIGALKAVGWTSSNVLRMILYEAFFLGVFGGVIGIALGFGVDELIHALVNINYSITPVLITSSFCFAVLLGVFSGVYPAMRASKLDPIEALRS